MSSSNVTVIHKDHPLFKDENSLASSLLKRFPHAAIHDGVHYVFADVSAIEDAIDINELVDEEGNKLEGDSLAWAIAKILAADDSSVLHMNRSDVQLLHNHPAWRIWCANYSEDDIGKFESDWNYITNLISVSMPEAAANWPPYTDQLTYAQGRQILLTAIGANS